MQITRVLRRRHARELIVIKQFLTDMFICLVYLLGFVDGLIMQKSVFVLHAAIITRSLIFGQTAGSTSLLNVQLD